MIPTSIPDELVREGTVRKVIAGPDGDLLSETIAPVDALISRDEATDLAAITVRLVLEPGELDALAAGQPVWLTMLGGLAPFHVHVGGE